MTSVVFADSSAVVKLYADEAGAERIRAIPRLIVSQLARVEVPAALWKKHRVGQISASSAGYLLADFEADYFGTPDEPPRLIAVHVTAAILEEAARLVGIHGLRAYDAVQLATSLAARAAALDLVFLAFDEPLCGAAIAERFELVDA